VPPRFREPLPSCFGSGAENLSLSAALPAPAPALPFPDNGLPGLLAAASRPPPAGNVARRAVECLPGTARTDSIQLLKQRSGSGAQG